MSANSHYADAASRIYLQQADSAARAAEQRGQIWGQALTNIGKVGGQAVTQIQADRREGQIAAIFKQYGNDFDKALPEVYKIDPVLGHKIAKQVYEQKTWAHELQDLQWKTDGRTLLTLREKLATVTDQVGWSAYLAAAQQAGQNVSGYPPEFDPAAVAQLGKKLEEASRLHQGAAPTKPEPFSLSPGQKRFDAAGNEIASVPPTPEKPPQPSYDQWVQEQLLKEQEAAAGTPAAAAPSAVTPTAPAPPASIALPAEGEGASVAPAPTPAAGAPAAGAPPKAPMTPAQIRVEAVRRAKEKTEEAKHSPAYVEWQDYKANGGTLDFDAYMTQDANRKAVRVTTGGAEDRVLVPIIGPDGKPVLVPRSEAVGKTPASAGSGAKPPTGAQNKTLGFFNRAKQADDDLQGLDAQIAKQGYFAQAWMKRGPNVLQSSEGQRYTQAQRAFTEARLRKDSGAAIPPQEFENDRKTYFVEPGDGPELIAQKARARAAVLASLAFESGGALEGFYGDEAPGMIDEFRARAKGATAPSRDGRGEAAPAAVTDALKSVGPGRYTLSDKTVWEKKADGSIVKAQ